MASYTNNSLAAFANGILSRLFHIQSKLDEANNEVNIKVLKQVRNFSDTITKLSSELSITKNFNT